MERYQRVFANPEARDESMRRVMMICDRVFERYGYKVTEAYTTHRLDEGPDSFHSERERWEAWAWDSLWCAANCIRRRSERSDNLRVALRAWGQYREYMGRLGCGGAWLNDCSIDVQHALEELIGEGA